jgi:predicted nucleic acid-binding protein
MNAFVDTDVLIDVLRKQEKAKNFLGGITKDDNITAHISVITEAEVLSGSECKETEKLEKSEALLGLFHAVDVTRALARKGAELRRQHDVALDDAIIAATVLEFDALLYTRNAGDFSKIKYLKIKVPY